MRTKEWEEKQVWLTNLVTTMMQQIRVREVSGVHNMTPNELWEQFAGKIKSFNNVGFSYYSSLDQPSLRGAQKTGNTLQVVNGITYYLWQ